MTERVDLRLGDCIATMKSMPDCSVDSAVTDPPYHLVSIVKRFGETSQSDDTDTSERSRSGADGYARLARGFMGQQWDGGDIAFRVETWAEVFRVLKPGGHLLAFSGTRTYHRMAVAIEDAGFEIRDMIAWMYGSGFPKSHSVPKSIDKRAGAYVPGEVLPTNRDIDDVEEGSREFRLSAKTAENPQTDAAKEWKGWGSAIKPAQEPICMARKPLIGTIADNVLEHRTGALNIDGCRIGSESTRRSVSIIGVQQFGGENHRPQHDAAPIDRENGSDIGRWPANVIHDGSPEVLAAFAQFGDKGAAAPVTNRGSDKFRNTYSVFAGRQEAGATFHDDSGTAARFFYCAKASRADRDAGLDDTFEKKPLNWSSGDQNPGSFQSEGTDKTARNNHPTVKPTDLMAYLCRLVTPPDGLVLDPFMGSGSTGRGAVLEGMRFIGCELSPDYLKIAAARIADAEREVVDEARRAAELARQSDMFAPAAVAPKAAPKATPQIDMFAAS